MDDKANEKLAQLRAEIQQDSLVKGIDDLQVGDVIYYDMDRADGINPMAYPSRLKYVVVAGDRSDDKEICAVLINSANDHSTDKDWIAEQYPILQKDYPSFLKHDSWIDCTSPHVLKVRKLKAKKAEKIDHLHSRDLSNVMTRLNENGFIQPRILKTFGIDKFGSSGISSDKN